MFATNERKHVRSHTLARNITPRLYIYTVISALSTIVGSAYGFCICLCSYEWRATGNKQLRYKFISEYSWHVSMRYGDKLHYFRSRAPSCWHYVTKSRYPGTVDLRGTSRCPRTPIRSSLSEDAYVYVMQRTGFRREFRGCGTPPPKKKYVLPDVRVTETIVTTHIKSQFAVNGNANGYSLISWLEIHQPQIPQLGYSWILGGLPNFRWEYLWGRNICSVGPISKLPSNPGQWAKFRPPMVIQEVNVFQASGGDPWPGALPMHPAEGSAENLNKDCSQCLENGYASRRQNVLSWQGQIKLEICSL